MPDQHDMLFRALADPTRRAIFERLCADGEQTVAALTARAGVSQPAVSKHLGLLKHAALVVARPTTARGSPPWRRSSAGPPG
jgi:DNA-binding transcriptional ArsR family regulator